MKILRNETALDLIKHKTKELAEEIAVIKDDPNLYVVLRWPEVQDYMEESWFEEECSLSVNEELHGCGAYFVPLRRLL